MKVYNRKEFLKLPEGTFFTRHDEESVGVIATLERKGETTPSGKDFYYGEVLDLDSDDDPYHGYRLGQAVMQARQEGISAEVPLDIGRGVWDGVFDEDELYLVLNKDEIQEIVAMLQTGL